jgi:hypothetical protein
MKGRICILAVATSTLLCGCLIAVCLRSLFVEDTLAHRRNDNSFVRIAVVSSRQGLLTLKYHHVQLVMASDNSAQLREFFGEGFDGFRYQHAPAPRITDCGTGRIENPFDFEFRRSSTHFGGSSKYFFLKVPYWLLVLLSGVAPTMWLLGLRSRRRKHRLQAGHCPNCNYDLRSTPHRCPECGYSVSGR